MADPTYGPAIYKKDGGSTLVVAAGGQMLNDAGGSVEYNVRLRVLTANVNAGATLLPAVAGMKYRIVDCAAIAIGGNAAAVTSVDILATQSTASVKLFSFAQAQLTRSTVLYEGVSGVTILTDGVSFVQNDVNTAITIGITGSAMTTATAIDVLLSYCLEA